MKYFSSLLLGAIMLFSCEEASEKMKEEFMPSARGEIGDIILVMDSAQWDGEIGSVVRSTLRQPMPGLPQDEPLFHVNKAGPRKLNSVLKSSKNMMFVMTLDSKSSDSKTLRGFFTDQSLKKIQQDTSLFMTVRRDEFAKGQVLLYVFASTEEQLLKKLRQNKSKIQGFFDGIEQKRIVSKLYKSHAKELEKEIADDHPFEMEVPFGWDLAVSTDNFCWIRRLDNDKEQNVFIYYEPYTNAEVFEDIPALRDRITEKYLRDSEKKDLFITRQMRDDIRAIFLKQTQYKGNFAMQARGLWKVSNNSLGGPYLSYAFVDEKQQMLFYIEGYVAAPGSKKAMLIREIDAVLTMFSSPGINN